jgi:pimeloyl-ACP methyl ester carboxylesterase
MALVLHAAALQLNLRVLAPDRPGIGQSSFQQRRTVQQYPADLAELCDQLGK